MDCAKQNPSPVKSLRRSPVGHVVPISGHDARFGEAYEAEAPGSMAALGRVLTLCNRITVDKTLKEIRPEMEFAADASEIGLFKRAFLLPGYHETREMYPKVAEVPFTGRSR